jgi:hypothetical protein
MMTEAKSVAVPIAVSALRCGNHDLSRHDVLQVSIATGSTLKQMTTATFTFAHKTTPVVEKRYKEEFWADKQHLWDSIRDESKHGESIETSWSTLRIAWDNITKDSRVVFAADENFFETLTAIHNGFERFCPRVSTHDQVTRVSPRFSLRGEARKTLNPFDLVKGFGVKRESALLFELDTIQKQTHKADDEARRCLSLYFLAMRELDTLPVSDTPAVATKNALSEFEDLLTFSSDRIG